MGNFRGLLYLSKREIIRYMIVVQQTLIPPLITSVLFMFIFGLSVGRYVPIGDVDTSYLGFIIPGLATMHLISSAFENTSSSLFIARWHNHIQEVLLSPLSYFEMVLGLLVGGLSRGLITASGVLLIAVFFEPMPVPHPFWLAFFMAAIGIIFSCAGMMAALWANNFGMLSVWNIYVITPLTFLGGVFNPISMLPEQLRTIASMNPMHLLVSGMRYSLMGIEEVPVLWSACLAATLAAGAFLLTVHLFKIGYKLRV